jgi:TolB-like protein
MKAHLTVVLALLPAVALSAEPRSAASRPSPPKIAVMGLTAIQVPQELADFYGDHFAQQLAFQGLAVVTRKEITALVGFERQRQLLGCDESSSCTLELAGALGADGLAVGSVAKVGKELHISVRIVGRNDGAALASFSANVQGEELTLTTYNQAAALMAPEVARKTGKPLGEKRVVQSEGGPRAWAWVPAAVGAVGFAGGTVFLLQAKGSHDRLTSTHATPLPYSEGETLRRAGESQQWLGLGGLGVGVVGAVAAGAMLLMGGSTSQVQGGVALAPGGVGLAIGGSFQ